MNLKPYKPQIKEIAHDIIMSGPETMEEAISFSFRLARTREDLPGYGITFDVAIAALLVSDRYTDEENRKLIRSRQAVSRLEEFVDSGSVTDKVASDAFLKSVRKDIYPLLAYWISVRNETALSEGTA